MVDATSNFILNRNGRKLKKVEKKNKVAVQL